MWTLFWALGWYIAGLVTAIVYYNWPVRATFHEPNVKISNLPKGTISTAAQAQFYEPISKEERFKNAKSLNDILDG